MATQAHRERGIATQAQGEDKGLAGHRRESDWVGRRARHTTGKCNDAGGERDQ